ncbi:hypothetical protein AgCh_011287 [Apium graveolens]
MVSETEFPVRSDSSSGATVGAIDWTTYSFPQAVELTGLSEKFNGGIGFSRWQKEMKLWLTIKGLWPVLEYEKPVVDQEKADTVKAFAKWAEKGGVARAAILVALTNTLFDFYSDAYSAKLLWEKLDQTHNTDSQGLEKYYVARFLEFKLVNNKSMTEQVHEFEMIVHALKQFGMDLPEKYKVGHWSKDCPTKKAKKTEVVAQANAVLGTASGPVANMVVGEASTSETDVDRYVSYNPSHSLTVKMGNASVAQVLRIGNVDMKFPSGQLIIRTFQFIDVDLGPMNGDIPETHKEKRK